MEEGVEEAKNLRGASDLCFGSSAFWLARPSGRVHCTHSSSSSTRPGFRARLGAGCLRALRRDGFAEDCKLRRVVLRLERECRRGIFWVRPFGGGLGAPRRQAWRRVDSSSGSREESSSGGESRGLGGTSRDHRIRPVVTREGSGRRHGARSFLRPSILRGPPSRLAKRGQKPRSVRRQRALVSAVEIPRSLLQSFGGGKRASPSGGERLRQKAETLEAEAGRPLSFTGEGAPFFTVRSGIARLRSSFPGGRGGAVGGKGRGSRVAAERRSS